MNEAVLSALRRPRVHVELEEFPPDEIAKPGLERLWILPRHGGGAGEREAETEHGRFLEKGPVGRSEAVQASRDQRLE